MSTDAEVLQECQRLAETFWPVCVVVVMADPVLKASVAAGVFAPMPKGKRREYHDSVLTFRAASARVAADGLLVILKEKAAGNEPNPVQWAKHESATDDSRIAAAAREYVRRARELEAEVDCDCEPEGCAPEWRALLAAVEGK